MRFAITNLKRTVCLSLLLFFSVPVFTLADTPVWPTWRAETADGKVFHSRQLDGKIALMMMWASWCPTCCRQLPILTSLQNRYSNSPFQVLTFSFDHSSDTHRNYVREHNFRLPAIFARQGEGLQVVRTLQEAAGTLEAVPTLLIYDKQGRLAHRLVGFYNQKQLEDLIAPLLSENI